MATEQKRPLPVRGQAELAEVNISAGEGYRGRGLASPVKMGRKMGQRGAQLGALAK